MTVSAVLVSFMCKSTHLTGVWL